MNSTPSNTILVVDDSPETLSLINDTLEQVGLTCLVALDPKQGLHIAQKMQPDLILVDGIMPTMTGFDFCKACKIEPDLRAIPIIFMTGMSDSESIVKAFAAGGIDYITKPIDTQGLIARIRVHLATANIIRGAQLALDQAGQHVFAVDLSGNLLWQTPDVKDHLEKHNALSTQESWIEETFWPAVTHWIQSIKHTENAVNLSLNLSGTSQTIHLELLNKNPLSPHKNHEILIRLHTTDDKEDNQALMNTFGVSQRESDVLIWIAKGKTNREIGHILGVSPRTINKHLEQVFKKLEVDNRTNAAAKAIPLLRR